MIVKSITLYNYRLYEGNNTIVFNNQRDKNICLISGENGFGKTTFLHSMIWCLYGRLITEVEAEVRKDIVNNGYNSFLKGNLNNNARTHFEEISDIDKEQIKRRGYTPENTHLKSVTTYYVAIDFADVVIPSLPCTSLKVVRSFDMVTEKESVEILIDGLKNELTAEIGSEVFINDFILNKDIARFFFFDSEQIVALAETNTSVEKKRLCSAYNEVLGVRKYEELKRNLENVRLRFRKKSSDVESRERLLALLEKQNDLENEIENVKQRTSDLEKELAILRTEDESLQLQLMREGNNATTLEIQRVESVIISAKQKDEEYKKAPWKVVIMHIPPQTGEDTWERAQPHFQDQVPTLVKAEPDIVLCGHDHRYQYYNKEDAKKLGFSFPYVVGDTKPLERATVERLDVKENELALTVFRGDGTTVTNEVWRK